MSSEKPKSGRRADRLEHELPVAYRTVDGFITDWATNLSRGGMFINSRTPLPVGTTVRIILQLPGAPVPFELRGRVTRVQEFDNPTNQVPGMGVEFVDVTDELRDRIAALRRAAPARAARAPAGCPDRPRAASSPTDTEPPDGRRHSPGRSRGPRRRRAAPLALESPAMTRRAPPRGRAERPGPDRARRARRPRSRSTSSASRRTGRASPRGTAGRSSSPAPCPASGSGSLPAAEGKVQRGRLLEVLRPSAERVTPGCPVAGTLRRLRLAPPRPRRTAAGARARGACRAGAAGRARHLDRRVAAHALGRRPRDASAGRPDLDGHGARLPPPAEPHPGGSRALPGPRRRPGAASRPPRAAACPARAEAALGEARVGRRPHLGGSRAGRTPSSPAPGRWRWRWSAPGCAGWPWSRSGGRPRTSGRPTLRSTAPLRPEVPLLLRPEAFSQAHAEATPLLVGRALELLAPRPGGRGAGAVRRERDLHLRPRGPGGLRPGGGGVGALGPARREGLDRGTPVERALRAGRRGEGRPGAGEGGPALRPAPRRSTADRRTRARHGWRRSSAFAGSSTSPVTPVRSPGIRPARCGGLPAPDAPARGHVPRDPPLRDAGRFERELVRRGDAASQPVRARAALLARGVGARLGDVVDPGPGPRPGTPRGPPRPRAGRVLPRPVVTAAGP